MPSETPREALPSYSPLETGPEAREEADVTSGEPPAAAVPRDPRMQEIAELEAQIAADRERVKQMISREGSSEALLTGDPELREIAERLPRLISELEALRSEPAPALP